MHVDRYERYWMWAATGMLVLFLSAIVITAISGAAHPPSHVETINPETLTIQGEFAAPGVPCAPRDGRP
jgi:cytochrome c oxidase subunit 2